VTCARGREAERMMRRLGASDCERWDVVMI
jgi:hypothetical protein